MTGRYEATSRDVLTLSNAIIRIQVYQSMIIMSMEYRLRQRPFHDSTSGPMLQPAGVTDMNTGNMGCPCNNNSNIMVPDYVGSNYYCESGTSTQLDCNGEFQQNDPLWDGLQCNNAETTCCPPGSNQPWFNSTLPQISNDSVELRLCTPSPDEDTPVDIIELYIR